MTEILALLQNIAPLFEEKKVIRQMSQVIIGMLVSSGRITMLGLSRWTEKGGSYRTIQRFYHNKLLWDSLQWLLFRTRLLKPENEHIIAGDEVVVSKSGKETYGLNRFFAGVQQRVIPGLSFFVLSLVNAANLSLFMVNFSYALLRPFRKHNPDYSILDLKSHYRGYRFASGTIKMLPEKSDAILLAEIFQQIARLGAIHPAFQPVTSQ